MYQPSSRLCTIPVDVLENVAFEAAMLDPLGPPSILIPLLLTCRWVDYHLSYKRNRYFHARLFKAMFDSRAAHRRFGERAVYPKNLTAQLRKQCIALKRIRQGNIYSKTLKKDLWTAFIMAMENDGKNLVQLEWANLGALLDKYMETRLWEDRHQSHGWPSESPSNALVIWLVWMAMDEAKLASLPPDKVKQIMAYIRPYVLTAARYPSFHAPDNHFDFPLPDELQREFPFTLMTPHGFYPLYRQPDAVVEQEFKHFNLPLNIAPPLIALGAKLLYMTLSQTMPFPILPSLPVNREHANQLGITRIGPTQADFIEVNAHQSVKFVERGTWEWRGALTEEEGKLEDDGVWRKGLKGPSARWDNDWNRLTCCTNPWVIPELKGVVYTYGTLSGQWQGLIQLPDIPQYFALCRAVEFPEDFSENNPRLQTMPLHMQLREHHCISPQQPVALGGLPHEFDDGIRNAWFPQISIRERGNIIHVTEELTGEVSQYETYVEGRPNSHDEDKCFSCVQRQDAEQVELKRRLQERQRQRVEQAEEKDEGESKGASSRASSSTGVSPVPEPPGSASRSRSTTPPDVDVDVEETRRAVNDALGPEIDVDELLSAVMGESEDTDDYDDDETQSDASSVVEYMEQTCNGIEDIIVTGETLPRHGQAWHNFRFYGRVRKWDGLIAIVRVPLQYRELGTFIFRGYIVANENFVGSWRAWTHHTHAIPLEGPFVASKV